MIKDICKLKAGILMEDILESDSGLFSKDQTLAAYDTLETGNIYVCILDSVWSVQPLCVYIEGDVSKNTAWMPVWWSVGGEASSHPACACTGASMQQNAFSSQKPLYHLVFLCISSLLFKRAAQDYEFSCILSSLLPKCLTRWSAGKTQLIYRGFC